MRVCSAARRASVSNTLPQLTGVSSPPGPPQSRAANPKASAAGTVSSIHRPLAGRSRTNAAAFS